MYTVIACQSKQNRAQLIKCVLFLLVKPTNLNQKHTVLAKNIDRSKFEKSNTYCFLMLNQPAFDVSA